MQTQGLIVDKSLHAQPQPLGLSTSDPGEFCHYNCTECRFVPGRGLLDEPDSHRGKIFHAGAPQVGRTQKDHAPLEKHGPPGALQFPWGAPADLTHVLRLLHP